MYLDHNHWPVNGLSLRSSSLENGCKRLLDVALSAPVKWQWWIRRQRRDRCLDRRTIGTWRASLAVRLEKTFHLRPERIITNNKHVSNFSNCLSPRPEQKHQPSRLRAVNFSARAMTGNIKNDLFGWKLLNCVRTTCKRVDWSRDAKSIIYVRLCLRHWFMEFVEETKLWLQGRLQVLRISNLIIKTESFNVIVAYGSASWLLSRIDAPPDSFDQTCVLCCHSTSLTIQIFAKTWYSHKISWLQRVHRLYNQNFAISHLWFSVNPMSNGNKTAVLFLFKCAYSSLFFSSLSKLLPS